MTSRRRPTLSVHITQRVTTSARVQMGLRKKIKGHFGYFLLVPFSDRCEKWRFCFSEKACRSVNYGCWEFVTDATPGMSSFILMNKSNMFPSAMAAHWNIVTSVSPRDQVGSSFSVSIDGCRSCRSEGVIKDNPPRTCPHRSFEKRKQVATARTSSKVLKRVSFRDPAVEVHYQQRSTMQSMLCLGSGNNTFDLDGTLATWCLPLVW